LKRGTGELCDSQHDLGISLIAYPGPNLHPWTSIQFDVVFHQRTVIINNLRSPPAQIFKEFLNAILH